MERIDGRAGQRGGEARGKARKNPNLGDRTARSLRKMDGGRRNGGKMVKTRRKCPECAISAKAAFARARARADTVFRVCISRDATRRD